MAVLESTCGNDGPTKMFEEQKSCSNIIYALNGLVQFYRSDDSSFHYIVEKLSSLIHLDFLF
jgi:hypothetical protein